jgi:4-amino-4-deoxy-L-arabinose transferase-like glycosyltransferase
VLSGAGIVATGLLARRVAGRAAGLVAASIAAFNPLWVQPSGVVLSEGVYLVVIPIMLLVALWCLERRGSIVKLLALGIAIGLAALTRSEAVLFIVFLGLPVALLAGSSARRRLVLVLSLLFGVSVTLGAWLVRNDLSMGGFTLSTDGGKTLVGSYTASTLSPTSTVYGAFDVFPVLVQVAHFSLSPPPRPAKNWTPRTLDSRLTAYAKSFAVDHLRDLPGVVLAREGRTWGVFAPSSSLTFDLGEERRVYGFQRAGQVLTWVVLPLAAWGTWMVMRRSRRRAMVLLSPVAVVIVNVAIFYGSTRMRVAAEPSLAALAAVPIAEGARRLARRTGSAEPVSGDRDGDVLGGESGDREGVEHLVEPEHIGERVRATEAVHESTQSVEDAAQNDQ